MRLTLICLLALMVACAKPAESPQTKELPLQKKIPLVPEPASPVSTAPEPGAEATSALDCTTLVTDDDMQGACKKVAAEEFNGFPTDTGCGYVKGVNSFNADVSIPEVGASQASENMAFATKQWTDKEPEKVNVGVAGYYGLQATVPHLWFVKGKYLVDVFSPFCSKEELQALATKIVGKLS